MFHHCRICVTDFMTSTHHLWAAPKRPILYRVKTIPTVSGNSLTYLSQILLKNKQKPIRKSCRSNLLSTPQLILLYTETRSCYSCLILYLHRLPIYSIFSSLVNFGSSRSHAFFKGAAFKNSEAATGAVCNFI